MTVPLTDMPIGLAWFLAIWLFGLGACAGSFMNVVIFRLPEKLALWKPNSRCPRCLHPIRSYDNIPILSWLFLLRAKCRDCKLPIPLRYPSVELLVGAVFLLFAVFEGLSGGANLPQHWPLPVHAIWLVYGAHMLLICVLICAAFMRFDGHQPPLRLYGFAFAVGVLVHWFSPHLPPAGVFFGISSMPAWLIGLCVGAAIGVASTAAADKRCGGASAVLEWALAGQFLGWQSVCWLAIAVALLVAIRNLTSGSLLRMPVSGLLCAAVMIWLLSWGRAAGAAPAWTRGADLGLLCLAILFGLSVALASASLEWHSRTSAAAPQGRPEPS